MNVLVVQRQSLVAGVDFSLSVYARIIEAMDWLRDQGMIQYAACGENDPALLKMLRWADAVIFNKHFSPRAIAIAREAREHDCVTLLDLDDHVIDFPKYSGGPRGSGQKAERLRIMCETVDFVTVSNAYLQREILPLRHDCALVPNGIYIEKYPNPAEAKTDPPRYVFTNADYLKLSAFKSDFLRVLQDFHRKHRKIILDFYGDPFPELLSLPFLHYTSRIPYTEYIRCLASTGYCFAITPLGSDEDAASVQFNRCKNPFKFLNYGICGIPAIYSDAVIYRDDIEQNKTGILVKNTYDDWFAAMKALAEDVELRTSIRKASYEKICTDYHIRTAARKFYELIM